MKHVRRIILLLLIIIIAVLSFVIYKGYLMYQDYITAAPLNSKIAKIKSNSNYVKMEDLPKYYTDAVIAVEDHRFKEHGPIDIIAIVRALVSNAKAKEFNEGGSTITQQVAKNLYFISEKNYLYRKIAEIFVSYDLENNFSKDDILEIYINTIYFGEGYYGIRQASKGYYNKEPNELTLYEATLLAGVPNAPSVYNPNVSPVLAKSRQSKVIQSMVEYGYLTKEEADNIKDNANQ